jgi:hypothetical protein
LAVEAISQDAIKEMGLGRAVSEGAKPAPDNMQPDKRSVGELGTEQANGEFREFYPTPNEIKD